MKRQLLAAAVALSVVLPVNAAGAVAAPIGAGTAVALAADIDPDLRIPEGEAPVAPESMDLFSLMGTSTDPVDTQQLVKEAGTPSVSTVSTCQPTQLTTWAKNQLNGFTADEITFIQHYQLVNIPSWDALLYGSAGDSRYALGARASAMSSTFSQLKRFWNVDSSGISLLAIHGSMLTDTARVARILQVRTRVTPEVALEQAQRIAAVMQRPNFRGGNHPLFSLNAFSYSSYGLPNASTLPSDRILVGDGMLSALDALGLGNVGAIATVAHEFDHHIQYRLGRIDRTVPATAASTRKVELHADSSASYFAVHPYGLGASSTWFASYKQVFAQSGDCALDSPQHHGTPTERARAAGWGGNRAAAAWYTWSLWGINTFSRYFDGAADNFLDANNSTTRTGW